jgi:hypothetical protein
MLPYRTSNGFFDGFTYIYVQVQHLKGDRQDFEFVKSSLSAKGYDVVYDINGNCFDA